MRGELGRYYLVPAALLLYSLVCLNARMHAQVNSPMRTVTVRKLMLLSTTQLSLSERERITRKLRERTREFAAAQQSTFLVRADEPELGVPLQEQELSGLAQELAREAYQANGYFKVEVSDQIMRTGGRAKMPWLDLTVPVTTGSQYRFGSVQWKNETVFSESELLRLMPTRPGEIFNGGRISEGLEAVRGAYQSRGYINFTCIPLTTVDDLKHTISLQIDIDEGAQFIFGNLHVDGMSEKDAQELMAAWQSLQGRSYSPQECKQFFQRFFRPLHRGVVPSDYTSIQLDVRARTVDVFITLRPDPSLISKSR